MHMIETPRFMTPEAIVQMQKHFARYWKVVWNVNPLNPKMRQAVLHRMPNCPLYVRDDPEKEPRFDPNHKHDD